MIVKLNDVCTKIGSGATPRGGKETYHNEGIALIRSQNVLDFVFSYDGLAYIDELQAKLLSNVTVDSCDILLNITGDSVARVCIVEDNVLPARVNQHVAIVRVNSEKADYRYIFYFLQHQKSLLLQMASGGATRNALTKSMIENLHVDLPSLENQRKISDILSSLDEKIANNAAINHHLEQIAQAIFKSWFVDFEPWGGVMPDDWRFGTLSEIAHITMGQSPDGESYNEGGEGEVFYQGRTDFGQRFPIRRLYTTQPKRMAKKGDVLVSVRAPVGDLNVAVEPCCVGRGLAAIQSKNESQSFILYTLHTLKQKMNLFNGEGTVFGSINKNDMANLSVSIPAANIINDFEAIVSPIDAIIETVSIENDKLSSIRDLLLPRLLSGELPVSDLPDVS